MSEAIGAVLPLALGIAISPISIIAVILMLFSPRARQNGVAFLAGWVLALTVVGAIVLVLAEAGRVGSDDSTSNVTALLKALLGVLFLFLASASGATARPRGEQAPMPNWMAAIDSFTTGRSLGLAALLAGVNPKEPGAHRRRRSGHRAGRGQGSVSGRCSHRLRRRREPLRGGPGLLLPRCG